MKKKKSIVVVKGAGLIKVLTEEVQHLAELLNAVDKQNRKLRSAVVDVGRLKGTCWCGGMVREIDRVMHTVECDHLYLALYGAERK